LFFARDFLWFSLTGCGCAARIGIRNSVVEKKERCRKTIDETSRATEKRLTSSHYCDEGLWHIFNISINENL
jgi:hypothetical protein